MILGSARRDGETRRAVDVAFPNGSIDLAILCDLHIGAYDYAHANAGDDFLPIVNRMGDTNTIVFATPVYWYSMSGRLKTFFDRLTDLLEIAKPESRAMAGKDMWLLATGTETGLPKGFQVPFRLTAKYFGMCFRGTGYLYTGSERESRQESEKSVSEFGASVLNSGSKAI